MDNTLKLEKDMTIDEIKAFLGLLKKDLKKVKNGARRSVFLNYILDGDSCYINELEHSKNYVEKSTQEKERANTFLNSREEGEKAGWYYTGGKKSILAENLKKQAEWTEKAYPNCDIDLWETELDIHNCVEILKAI